MAPIKAVRNFTPQMGINCYLAKNATLIGAECNVWFQAVMCGDGNSIRMGNRMNLQDGAIIYGTYETAAAHIGDSVCIGHRALVHGCTIHHHVVVGRGQPTRSPSMSLAIARS